MWTIYINPYELAVNIDMLIYYNEPKPLIWFTAELLSKAMLLYNLMTIENWEFNSAVVWIWIYL